LIGRVTHNQRTCNIILQLVVLCIVDPTSTMNNTTYMNGVYSSSYKLIL